MLKYVLYDIRFLSSRATPYMLHNDQQGFVQYLFSSDRRPYITNDSLQIV